MTSAIQNAVFNDKVRLVSLLKIKPHKLWNNFHIFRFSTLLDPYEQS